MLRWLALAALVAAGCVSAADAQQHIDAINFILHPDNGNPTGIWSDRTTMWVADQLDAKIYAYSMSGMSRDTSNDFSSTTLTNAGNNDPPDIWSDRTTMWVADFSADKIYAYNMVTKSRVGSEEFTLHPNNTDPYGIWSNGATMWVVDNADNKIYAYNMVTKSRVGSEEFTLHPNNTNPTGIWSDRTTMWVADIADGKLYAYKMSDKSYDESKDFDTLDGAGNKKPTGIWSDRTTMWVADFGDDKIYAYRMPAAPAGPSQHTSVYVPPPDTTPPRVVSVERTGNATTTDRTLTWEVTFSEPVTVQDDGAAFHAAAASAANATIPDLGAVRDAVLVDGPDEVAGGSVSMDVDHTILSNLLIELVAPDCTRFTIHNQTTTFPHKLRDPYDLGDLSGVGAAGQWTLHISDRVKYWNGTLNSWSLELVSYGVVEGDRRVYEITQHVAGPGNHTLSLDTYEIRDRAGNQLRDPEPRKANEPYHVVGAAARTCQG